MDRRQQKTRAAIFDAFSTLLKTKKFNNITVQEIIDEANIGRSTFYSHFETKDELLKAMCTDIFTHIFSEELSKEKTHDFSKDYNGLEQKITHILYHLKDSKRDIKGILSCESGELFIKYFKEYLSEMFEQYTNTLTQNVPSDFLLNHLSGSLVNAIQWWIKKDMEIPPEKISKYYMKLIRI
ncbi:MAG: TetR/AcrR family transcriptional regulator [Clostridia bacterium]|nr:TetR/AcrR family transcriptional regulator [Clostridia bacterium]